MSNNWRMIFFLLGTPLITLALTIWIYFVWRKVYKHKEGGGWRALIPTVLTVPGIGLGVLFVIGMTFLWYPNLDFKHERWLRQTERRYRMTRDIIESGMLIGKTRREVERMLSPDYIFPEARDYGSGAFGTDTTRMVWYIGWRPGGLMTLPPNSLALRLENGLVAEVREEYNDIPDGAAVRMSGFVIDPSLDTVTFSGRDRVIDRSGESDGSARIERYFEKEGVRTWNCHPLPPPWGIGRREWNRKMATVRDSLTSLYLVTDGFEEYHETYDRYQMLMGSDIFLAFDHHAGNGCRVSVRYDTLPAPSTRSRPTVVVWASLRIFTYSDVANENDPNIVPDSIHLAFSRMPVGEGRLVGHIHASKKDHSWEGDVVFDGVFEVHLPEYPFTLR